jgi:hypothetical protein
MYARGIGGVGPIQLHLRGLRRHDVFPRFGARQAGCAPVSRSLRMKFTSSVCIARLVMPLRRLLISSRLSINFITSAIRDAVRKSPTCAPGGGRTVRQRPIFADHTARTRLSWTLFGTPHHRQVSWIGWRTRGCRAPGLGTTSSRKS